jgi:streptogramin lyase
MVECLTGHVPYPRDLEVGVLWAHVEEPPPTVTGERPDLPAEVDDVVSSAMAKDPNGRTATAGQVASGLRSALRLEPPTGEVPTRPTAPAARGPRRGTALVVAGIAFVALLAVGAVLLIAGGGGGGVVPRANSVGRIDSGAAAFTTPVGVGMDPTGVTVGEDGDVWVINQGDSTVSRIENGSGEVVSTKSTLGIPTGIAAGEDAVWITNGFGDPSGSGEVVRVDLTDESVEPAFPSGSAKALVVAFGSIWLADTDRDRVLRYDPDDLSAEPIAIPVDDDDVADAAPRSIAMGDGAAEGIWVVNQLGDTVIAIDPERNKVTDRIQVEEPTAVAADDTGVWVTSETHDLVLRFDPADTRALRTYQAADGIPDGPTSIVVGPSGVWVGSDLDEAVVRIDPGTNAIDRLRLGGITGDMAVDERGDVWVTVRAQKV